jgi:hypothetical protein
MKDIGSLLHEALDTALKNYVVQEFDMWMRDATEQPQRAAAGTKKAIAAYREACKAIDDWMKETES